MEAPRAIADLACYKCKAPSELRRHVRLVFPRRPLARHVVRMKRRLGLFPCGGGRRWGGNLLESGRERRRRRGRRDRLRHCRGSGFRRRRDPLRRHRRRRIRRMGHSPLDRRSRGKGGDGCYPCAHPDPTSTRFRLQLEHPLAPLDGRRFRARRKRLDCPERIRSRKGRHLGAIRIDPFDALVRDARPRVRQE
jgi:hypothetical protein